MVFADENSVKVELLAKNIKVCLPRTSVEVRDPTKPLEMKGVGVDQMSFEEAQKHEMGQDDVDSVFGDKVDRLRNQGRLTPVGDAGGKFLYRLNL